MPEDIKTPEIPVTEPVVEKVGTPEDLISRVSKVKTPEQAKGEIDEKFNINDLDTEIDKLPDPKLKEQVLGLKKSLLKGENQKYQEIANLRKQYETELAKQTSWTPERIQSLLNDPNFVNSAQSIINKQSNNDSMLSDAEKKVLEENNRNINLLIQQNQQLMKQQQDVAFKQRYANYDPEVVDKVTTDMIQGKVQATREHLWKAIDYDNAVKRAYELGLTDKNTQNQEKVTGMTFDAGRNMATPTTMKKEKGETTQAFILRSYAEHIKKK